MSPHHPLFQLQTNARLWKFLMMENSKPSFRSERGSETGGLSVISSAGANEGLFYARFNFGAPWSATRYAPAAGYPSPTSTRSYSAAAL
jgi:hypothetical protein